MKSYSLNMEDKKGCTWSPVIRALNYAEAIKTGRRMAKKEGCKFLSIRAI